MSVLYSLRVNFNKVQNLIFSKAFGFIAFLIFSFNSYSQTCANSGFGSEPTLIIALSPAISCTQSTTGATSGIGSGSRRIYTGFTAGDMVQLRVMINTSMVNCADGRWLDAANNPIGGWFTINTGGYTNLTVPAGADRLEVSTGKANAGDWNTTSATLRYRLRSPGATTVVDDGVTCSAPGATLTATGGANGTIYWQNTTSGGTSTATPSSSQIVTSSGTYYFRSQNPNGCWGTEGSVTVTIGTSPVITGTFSACVGGTSDLTTAEADWSGLPTGGTVTIIGTERVHRFTTSGTFNTPQAISGAQVLVVGGGGGGGSNGGGGGGAGGLVYNSGVAIASGNTTATVGTGGACCGSPAGNGTGSAFGAITAGGGGGGASRDAGAGGQNGGSGGGGGGATASPRHLGGTGTVGQGNNGGNGTTPNAGCFSAGGGGGGAGGAGGAASNDLGGVGGPGLAYDITGTSLFYAAGGGGGLTGYPGCGGSTASSPGGSAGGSGIGGNGESTAGTANTGSGGGAERAGATGVVIVRYNAPNWSSSNPAIATVNPLTGLVTAVSAGTTTITYTSPNGCTDSQLFTVNSPNTAPTSISGAATICPGNTVTLTKVGGTGTAEWFTGSCGGTSAGTGNSITVSPTATTTYYVRSSANGVCPATACVNGNVTLPSQAGPLSNNNESATCAVSENNWVHFYHSSGRLIASINSAGQNLGNVTVTSYVDGAPSLVDACDEPGNVGYQTSYMQRHWVITPSIQPINPVQVRLPFTNTELGNLSGASILNSNPNDNVAIIGDVLLSKYSGPNNVDNNAPNNCIALGGNEGTTLYGQTANGVVTSYAPAIGSSQYIDYTIPGFSEFWLHGSSNNSPLPVELTSFTADCQEDGRVELKWVTSSEHNSSYFMVEKSSDALSWEDLVMVAAAGNTSSTSYYTAIDENSRGTNYYRLIQVDNNGESKVYDALVANCNVDKVGMNLFPNPASSVVTLELNENIDTENVYVGFYDVHGKMIKRVDINQNNDKYIYVDVKDLSSGYYIVRLFDGQSEKQPIRFVKQ